MAITEDAKMGLIVVCLIGLFLWNAVDRKAAYRAALRRRIAYR